MTESKGYRERIVAAPDMAEAQRLYDEAMKFSRTADPKTVRAWARALDKRSKMSSPAPQAKS